MKQVTKYFSALIFLLILSQTFQVAAQQFVVFNDIYKSTNFSTSKINSMAKVTGYTFKFIPDAGTFPSSGNNLAGRIEYYDASFVKQTITGTADGKNSGGTTTMIVFVNTADTERYVFPLPGNEGSYSNSSTPGFNQSGVADALYSLYGTQSSATASSASVVMSMSDPVEVTESNTAYIEFVLTFSTARSNTVTFTPTLTGGTATSGTDYTNTVSFSTDNFSTSTTTTPFTVPAATNTVKMRVYLNDDNTVESAETFTLSTGAFGGTSASQLANGAGIVANGTILNSVSVSMSDPSAVTESNSAYINFSMTLSADRNSASSDITFTPTITDVTTTAGSDYTNTVQFSTDNVSFSSTAPFTIPYNVNTVYMRVALKDDALPESDETFTLSTGTFGGTGATEIKSGTTSASATGTISDDGDPYLWTGGTSTDWNTGSNWNAGTVPPSTANAKIPTGVPNYPAISSNNSITDLEIVSGASLGTGGSTLTVLGNLTHNGTITGTGLNGKLSMGGSSSQTISGTGSIDNLELNNSLGATISSGTLTLNKGFFPSSGVLTTNGNLNMNSNASYTASVFQRGGSCTTYISGNVTLNRYIDPAGNSSYRFIGNPFNSTTKSFGSFSNLPLTKAYRYNTSFASPDPTNANGDPAWASVVGADIFEQYRGIITFLTGSTPFTVQASGTINQCDVTINVSSYSNNDLNKGFVLLSNPYMSYLDLSQNSTRSNVQDGFYVWDTGTNTTDGSSQKSRQAKYNYKGKYNTVIPGQNDVAKIVPPLGAFFIKVAQGATQVSGSITFKETEKWNSNSIADYIPFSVKNPAKSNLTTTVSKPYIYNLRLFNNGNEVDLYRLVFRDEAKNEYDTWDLTKMLNSDLNLYSMMPNSKYFYAVDTRSTTLTNFEIPLYLTTKLDVSNEPFEFHWNADGQTIDANFVLEDNLTHNKYYLNNSSKIAFTPGKFDNSQPRFKLLVSPKSSENADTQKVVAYPNPFTNYLYVGPVENLSGTTSVDILNMVGLPVHSTTVEMAPNVAKYLTLPTLPNGSYILKLVDSKGSIYTQKLIKQ